MKPTDLEGLLRAIVWPAPSLELRARVLAAAVVEPSITWSDRLWFSRASRLSVAAVILGLITLNQLSGSRESAALVPSPRVGLEAQAIEDTSRQIGLPADVAALLARRVLAESRPRSTARRIVPTADWPTDGGDSR